ncbi:CocE/NonD family hydrolase [Cellulomonas sp. URHB0016]
MRATSPTTAAHVVEADVPVLLTDGTTLRATVHRPAGPGTVPVVLALTPYPVDAARQEMADQALVEQGMAVVVVALRGTGGSEGTFVPWQHHVEDARDVLDWCSRQPWSAGSVVGWGRSYLAQTLLFLASAAHPALRAMHLAVVPGDPEEVTYRGGALVLGSALNWATAMSRGEILRAGAAGAAGEDVAAELGQWEALAEDLDAAARSAPLRDVPVLDRRFPAWRDWVTHDAGDPWWAERALAPRPAVPTLFVAGWHDLFRDLTLRQFGISNHPASRLVVGPWGHGAPGRAMGEIDYGRAAARGAEELGAQGVAFLAAHAHGEPARSSGPRVRVFVMGENAWRDFDEWPPARATPALFHLAPAGALAPEAVEGAAAPSTFDFDPHDPVPTVGGPNLFDRGEAARGAGPWDQSSLDGRSDVLRFVSAPLDHDLTVIGDVVVHLFASTDAVDTDWTAKLVDLHPDGSAMAVVDGIARVRAVLGGLVPPGEVREVVVELGATAQTFAAGHRLRLDVSSSNFPRFDVNPGTGTAAGVTPSHLYRRAHQQVHHDGRHHSRLVLPAVLDDPSRTG